MSLGTGTLTTREKLIKAGREIFYRDGFHCAGLDQVLREAGLTKTTFYNHFSSKEELIQEVIDYHEARLREKFRDGINRLAGDSAPVDRLMAVFDVMQEYFDNEKYNGCMMINAALVFPIAEDPINVAAMRNKQFLNQQIAELALAAGVTDIDAFLTEFQIIFDGTVISRHIFGNKDAARIGAQLAANMIERFIGTAGERMQGPHFKGQSRREPSSNPLPQMKHSTPPLETPADLLTMREMDQR